MFFVYEKCKRRYSNADDALYLPEPAIPVTQMFSEPKPD
jgi:hypothetical protein